MERKNLHGGNIYKFAAAKVLYRRLLLTSVPISIRWE